MRIRYGAPRILPGIRMPAAGETFFKLFVAYLICPLPQVLRTGLEVLAAKFMVLVEFGRLTHNLENAKK